MKVILLQNVVRVGQKYEVKNVPDGHALNYLIPRKLVEPATKNNLKRLKDLEGKRVLSIEEEVIAFKEALVKLQNDKVVLTVSANEKGHLFKGMKTDDIANCIKEKGIKLSAEYIDLKVPIKEVGTYEIIVHLGETKGVFELEIIASEK